MLASAEAFVLPARCRMRGRYAIVTRMLLGWAQEAEGAGGRLDFQAFSASTHNSQSRELTNLHDVRQVSGITLNVAMSRFPLVMVRASAKVAPSPHWPAFTHTAGAGSGRRRRSRSESPLFPKSDSRWGIIVTWTTVRHNFATSGESNSPVLSLERGRVMASLGSFAGVFFAGLLVGQAALIVVLSLVRQNSGEPERSASLAAEHDEAPEAMPMALV
jgi:hypothetical protein